MNGLLLAVFASLNHQGVPASMARADTALRTALVRVVSDTTRLSVSLDPAVIPAELDTLAVAEGPSGDQRSASLRSRLDGLVRVGLRSAPEGIRNGCAGTMVRRSQDSVHRGCPKEAVVVLVAGTPRPIDSGGQGEARTDSMWSIRTIETFVGPLGFNLTVYDYVFANRKGQWVLIRRDGRLVVE